MDFLDVDSHCPRHVLGLVGPARDVRSALDFLMHTDNGGAAAPLNIAGAVIEAGEDETAPETHGVALYDSVPKLLEGEPEVDIILVLHDGAEQVDAVRRETGLGVSVIDRRAARLFLSMGLCHPQSPLGGNALVRAIMDEMSEDLLLLDLEGRVVDMNRRVFEDKGKTREELLGVYCWELEGRGFCCDNQTTDNSCPYRQTAATGEKTDSIHTVVDDAGRMRYYRVYTYPVFSVRGELTHIVELRRDITGRTNMEFRLQQSEKMAAIGELATYIAHEIRNPLFSIGGFANALVRSKSLDETAREKASIILEESRRLDAILKAILNFSRPIETKGGAVDVNDLVVSTMDLMGMGCEHKGISINVETAPDLPKIKAEAELVKQMLINMVKNAIEAMPDGGGLTVRTSLTPKFVLLEVMDTGSGIPDDIREKVFNPFFSTKDQGAGLGLAMTKKIVEDLGGKVDLASKPGEGTRVSILLPPVLAVEEEQQS